MPQNILVPFATQTTISRYPEASGMTPNGSPQNAQFGSGCLDGFSKIQI